MNKYRLVAALVSGSIWYSNVYADNEVLSNSAILGYAYMQDGTKLVKVSMSGDEEHDKDIELIRITEGGFYPNYSMNTKTENGGGGEKACAVTMDDNDKDKPFCRSHYTSREALMTGMAALFNAAATFTTVGLNVVAGAVADPKYFHKNDFLEIVKKNNLQKYREELLTIHLKREEVRQYTYQKSAELDTMYQKALDEYTSNQENITFNYKVTDKSGLLPNKELDGGYTIGLNIPARKNYSYVHYLTNEKLVKETALTQLDTIKSKIDQQYETDAKEYKGYIAGSFKNYKIIGQAKKRYFYNDYISFESALKAPSEVVYSLGKKMTIDIPITVESANLNNMVPREYMLNDTNFQAIMRAGSDMSVNGVLTNKTQSFITVKSLTGYYQGLVHNLSNLDKELAPESKDLDDGSRYPLLSSGMKEKAYFSNITKSKAENTKINYGYAIKYKINDTNIEKAIYNTKNISLYDIYRQYL